MNIKNLSIDVNIYALVKEINRFPGIYTTGSCGGHADPKPGQEDLGHGHVFFKIDNPAKGFRSLDFLAWACDGKNLAKAANINIGLYPVLPVDRDKAHYFCFEVETDDFDHTAETLKNLRRQYYKKITRFSQQQTTGSWSQELLQLANRTRKLTFIFPTFSTRSA